MDKTLASYPDRINVVIPLFNDWQALGLLLERIQAVNEDTLVRRLDFLIVDDCSSANYETLPTGIGQSLSILRLFRNVGHQKAIALGLSHLASLPEQYPTIVMDSDGEDRPEDIPELIKTGVGNPNRIVFAHRAKRHESLVFRLFYEVYKRVFQLLTGKVITFGNFSLVPAQQLRKLTHVSEIWNNYPGGVIRSRLPYTAVPLERGRRLAGESKMNFVSLVLHGLSAVSVLMDTTAVRLALFCVIMVVISISGIGMVVALRLFTDTAVPGWANYLVFSFLIVILQAFLISLLLVFIVLSYRTQPQFIPARQFQDFVEKVEKVY
ncbi:glycosyltransferase [Spirosoma fluviale]|uniref:Glycosyltransferase involved in cell wall bisynthesis n=1 Tax=Spirosoma fluviale TaxID=1597977 RepID=A0A286F8L9_9BACT|nr:glycosyltransferase [Spirosoma fluviale]SOD79533.1 Glycosyltransferase involved in cell wall bisynthesis [Spirosoma fluviale]